MCMVVNKYREAYDVYIGRGSVWGNPFPITNLQDREEVISKYSKYLWNKIKGGEITIEMLLSLEGKKLGCFCKPLPCHGDIIVKAVAWAKTK